MTTKLYYIETDRGCGLRAAASLAQAEALARREVGSDYVEDVRLASEDDISWIKGMGGYVPTIQEVSR